MKNSCQVNVPATQTYELPEDGQELRQKHVGAMVNNNVQQVGVNYLRVCMYIYIYSKEKLLNV
jgi:hypothetical protein